MLRVSVIKRVMRMRQALLRDPVTGDLHPDDAAYLARTLPASPILRTCSFCGSHPMRECTTPSGKKVKFHKQRRAPSLGRR
jgi:hypothetical protein